MNLISLPTIALVASQDITFQISFVLVVFLVLNSLVWNPAIAQPKSEPRAAAIADPEEDYLPKEYQKVGPSPTEMEAVCRWEVSELSLNEWQALLYASKRQA